MLRSQVVQPILDLFEAPCYLEIGVNAGETFRALRAGRKVAVDPAFLFDTAAAAAADRSAEFHEVTSDAYFHALAPDAPPFDVVFIDGLHTLEQSLRDLMNTLTHVHRRSVIVLDDVLPLNHAASLREIGQWVRLRELSPDLPDAWMGDVYRLVYFVAAFLPDWSYATVAENHGQTVMWRGARPVVERTVEAVARTSYEDTVLDRAVFNLQPFETVRGRLAAALA